MGLRPLIVTAAVAATIRHPSRVGLAALKINEQMKCFEATANKSRKLEIPRTSTTRFLLLLHAARRGAARRRIGFRDLSECARAAALTKISHRSMKHAHLFTRKTLQFVREGTVGRGVGAETLST